MAAIVYLMLSVFAASAFAQKSTQETMREFEASNRAIQLQLEQSRLSLQRMQAETERRDFEMERLRFETEQLRTRNQVQDVANRALEQSERAERAAMEQAEAAKKAEEAAEELRDELELSSVRTKNNVYLGVFVLSIIGLLWYFVRESRNEEIMKESQKVGIATVICSILALIMAVMISDGWTRYDLLQNLMTSLNIRLFAENGCTVLCSDYAVDFPTKYAVLACLCSAAYGFTTFLGITPVPRVNGLNAK